MRGEAVGEKLLAKSLLSMEPAVGLSLTTQEIMTGAKTQESEA